MFQDVSVIINPVAGGHRNSKGLADRVLRHLSKNGHDNSVQVTSRNGDATRFAAKAVRNSKDLVVVMGGDGTINEVASNLVGTSVPLAIIPLGSGNGLARSLEIPTHPEKACELIADGQVSTIDVGKVNGRYFFLVLGVGFDAMVGKSFNTFHKRGPLPYFYLGFREYFRHQPEEITIRFGDETLTIHPFLVCVANGQQYGNNAKIAPNAKLNDGLLDLCIVHQLTVPQLFSAVPKLFKGRLTDYSAAEFHRACEVTIERRTSEYVNLDGEAVLEKAVLNVSVVPNALQVITPTQCSSLSR